MTDLVLDTIINGDSFIEIKKIPDNSIDLVITSPPYAEKRKHVYGGISADKYAEWLFELSHDIMRIIKPTGSFVLNINEGTKNGCKELYVLEYLLLMAKTYRWVETFIWAKLNPFPTGNLKRLKDGFEYCYQFTKTPDYKFFPKNVLYKTESKWTNNNRKDAPHATNNGSGFVMSTRVKNEYVRPSNVITFPSSCLNIPHCAAFPIDLPDFFIKLMTEDNDIILDPFMGSGTTALSAIKNNRHYIGIEILPEYCDLINSRINKENNI